MHEKIYAGSGPRCRWRTALLVLLLLTCACSGQTGSVSITTGATESNAPSSNASPSSSASTSSSSGAGTPSSVSQDPAAAYCETFYTKGAEFRNTYYAVDAQTDPLGAFVALVGAPQEVSLFFGELGTVAPPEIQPSILVLQQAMQKVSDNLATNATNPLQAMLEALVVSSTTKPSFDRVNAYTLEKCGPPPGSPSTIPGPGATVFSLTTTPETSIAMGASTIVAMGSVNGATGIQSFDLGGKQLASNSDTKSYTPDCNLVMTRRSDGVDVVLTVKSTVTQAQGVNPGGTSLTLVASDGATLKELWETPLESTKVSSELCKPNITAVNEIDLANTISFSSDGNWALLTASSPSIVFNLNTGVAHDIPNGRQFAGNFAISAEVFDSGDAKYISVVDPATGAELSHLDGVGGEGLSELMYAVGAKKLASSGGDAFISLGGYALTSTPKAQAFSLPGLASIWSIDAPGAGNMFVDPQTETVILVSTPTITAVNAATGAKQWQSPPVEDVCGVASGKVLVTANGQLAVLDALSGTQLTFDPNVSRCPNMLTQGYAYTENSNDTNITVTRVL